MDQASVATPLLPAGDPVTAGGYFILGALTWLGFVALLVRVAMILGRGDWED